MIRIKKPAPQACAMVILLSLFVLPVMGQTLDAAGCLTRTESNHTFIINRTGGNLAFGNIVKAYDPDGMCVGIDTLGDGNAAIALWGEDSIDPAGGLRPGEAFRLMMVRGAVEVPVTYNVASGPTVYQPNAITVGNTFVAAEPGEPGELDVAFQEQTVDIVDGPFERVINITGSFGAAVVRINGVGVDLTNISVTPNTYGALDVYQSDTLLAVGIILPEEESYQVTVNATPVLNEGLLTISNVEVVDSLNNIIVATVSNGISTFRLLILGDIDGDGVVNLADVTAIFMDLINIAPLDQQERERADVFPFPGGNNIINIQDLFILGRAVIRNQWPDGSSLD